MASTPRLDLAAPRRCRICSMEGTSWRCSCDRKMIAMAIVKMCVKKSTERPQEQARKTSCCSTV